MLVTVWPPSRQMSYVAFAPLRQAGGIARVAVKDLGFAFSLGETYRSDLKMDIC